jgi:hypothetical protein
LISADGSLPEHVITNHHIAEFVTRQFGAQRSYPLQSVNMLFSGYPASTLLRYGLNYVTSYYFHGPVTLLPPDRNAPPELNRPVPFTVAVVLFQHEKRFGDLLSALQFILPQVVLAAKNRGLLPDAQATPTPPLRQEATGPASQQRSQLASNGPASQQISQMDFWQLIPRRHGEDELLMSSNPFARSVDLPDKQTRRIYGAIDGKRSIGEITRTTKMDAQEAVDALRKLIVQRRVELYEPGGKLVNPSHFLA